MSAQFIVLLSGLATGSLYALVGMSLSVVYRSGRIINFALGAIGGVCAYAVLLFTEHGLSIWLAMAIAVLLAAIFSALVEIVVIRPLRKRARGSVTIGMACLGMAVLLQGILGWRAGYSARTVPALLSSGHSWRLGWVIAQPIQIVVISIALTSCLAVSVLVGHTNWGIALRAASSGPHTSSLLGIDRNRVALAASTVAGVCIGVAAMLEVPLASLDPYSFTLFMLTAFVAVVLGGFVSLGGVVMGGLVLGMALNEMQYGLGGRYTSTSSFVLIAIILAFKPTGIFGREERMVPEADLPHRPRRGSRWKSLSQKYNNSRRRGANWTISRLRSLPAPVAPLVEHRWYRQGVLAVLGLAILGLLPLIMSGQSVLTLPSFAALFIAVLSVNFLFAESGQLSLGHSGFMAIGAYSTALLGTRAHMPVLLELVLTIAICTVAGALIGGLLTRLGVVEMAVASLLFSGVVPEIATASKTLGNGSGLAVPVPGWFAGPAREYLLICVVAIVCVLALLVFKRGRLGRAIRAVRDNRAGAVTLGVRPWIMRTLAFAISAGLAGLAGALSAQNTGYISPDTYTVWLSAYLVVAMVFGGAGSIVGCVVGAFFIAFLPVYAGSWGVPPDVFFGAALVLVLLIAPGGVIGLAKSLQEQVMGRAAEGDSAVGLSVPPATESFGRKGRVDSYGSVAAQESVVRLDVSRTNQISEMPILQIDGISVRYGSLEAVHQVSCRVGHGEVVALLGSNGAGKSTVLRSVSGLCDVTLGDILVSGVSIKGMAPHMIASLGVAHVPEGRGIFPGLSVHENLALGVQAARGRPSDSSGPFDSAVQALEFTMGLFPMLRDLDKRNAGSLSGGEQQFLAIARALCAQPRLLLLDEPSLGVSPLITERLFSSLPELTKCGISVLLVEQNAAAALASCNHAYVLRSGTVVLEGDSRELIDRSEALRQAYLGASAQPTSSLGGVGKSLR